MSIIEFNDPHGNKFGVSISEVRPDINSLYPSIRIDLELTHKQNGPFSVSNPIGHVRIESEEKKLFAGALHFEFSMIELNVGGHHSTSAHLVLDPYRILQIEKIRANKNIKATLNMQFSILKRERQSVRFSNTTTGTLQFEIAQSKWITEFLPAFNYREVSLIEVPKLESDQYSRVIEYLDDAWRYNFMGQYDIVLINCRRAIEELGDIVRGFGFSMKKSLDDGREITVADWRSYLNQGEVGKYFEEITESIRRFCNRAAHSGKSINKEDADYALLATHATANFLLWNFHKRELFS